MYLREFDINDMTYGSSSYGSSPFGAFANVPPGHIIATNISSDKNACIEPCDLTINVTWKNDGGSATIFTPKILVNSSPNVLPDESLDPGSNITKTFSLASLSAGNYTICPDPNSLSCLTITVLSPANIISATLTVDTNDCVAPCKVNGTISWTNNGGSPGIVDLVILVNSSPLIISSDTTLNPGDTLQFTFQLQDLIVGTYSICASPDAGTSCQTIIVRSPTNIIATDININKTTCAAPCDAVVDVTWTNNGGVSGAFIPEITIDGVSNITSSVTLGPGESATRTFGLTGLTAGVHTICAAPLGITICKTLAVTQVQVQQVGVGQILALGLLTGLFLSSRRNKKKNDTIDKIQSLVDRSKESLDMIVNDAVPNCSALLFAYLSGEIGKTNGAAVLAHNMYPDDKRLSDLLAESQSNMSKAFDAGNRFELECICSQESKLM